MGDRRGARRVLVLNVREEDHLEDLSVGGRVILKRILNRFGGRKLHSCGSRLGQIACCCECRNEPSDYTKLGGVLAN